MGDELSAGPKLDLVRPQVMNSAPTAAMIGPQMVFLVVPLCEQTVVRGGL